MPLDVPGGHHRRAPRLPPRRRGVRRVATSARSGCEGAGALERAAGGVHQRPRQGRARAGAVHAPARRRRRLGARRHHRVVGRRRRLRRDAQRLEHRPGRRGCRSAATATSPTSRRRAIIAVQGPNARERLAAVLARGRGGRPVPGRAPSTWHGVACTVAGTGYTGEDGVEIAVPADARRGALGRRARPPASRPPGSAPATRCASRPACRCTATSSARASPRCRPGSAGSWRGTRATSGAEAALAAEQDAGRAPAGCAASRTEGRRPPRADQPGARRRRRPSAWSPAATSRPCSSTASPWRSCRPTSPTAPRWPSTCAAAACPAPSCPRPSSPSTEHEPAPQRRAGRQPTSSTIQLLPSSRRTVSPADQPPVSSGGWARPRARPATTGSPPQDRRAVPARGPVAAAGGPVVDDGEGVVAHHHEAGRVGPQRHVAAAARVDEAPPALHVGHGRLAGEAEHARAPSCRRRPT